MKMIDKNLYSSVKKYLCEEDVCQANWLLGLVQDNFMEYDELRQDFYELPNARQIEFFCKACILKNVLDKSFTSEKMIDLWKSVGIVYHGEYCNDVAVISPAYVTLDHRRIFKSRGYMGLLAWDVNNEIESMMKKFVDRKYEEEYVESFEDLPF
jgi:hypothetical protein